MQCDYERVSADDTPSEPWLAIGLDLTLVPTAEGGRSIPVFLDTPFGYRPNWGLPGMTGTDQTGAPVLCSSASPLAPGHSARVVVIPFPNETMVQWRLLEQGDRLRMFEGSRVSGHATVRWVDNTSLPVPGTDEARFRAWATSTDDRPAPA
jgi:hypothetical protein